MVHRALQVGLVAWAVVGAGARAAALEVVTPAAVDALVALEGVEADGSAVGGRLVSRTDDRITQVQLLVEADGRFETRVSILGLTRQPTR